MAKNPADVAALSAPPMGGRYRRVRRSALVGKIGENMSIRRFVRMEAKGKLTSYVHGGSRSASSSTWSAATSNWPRSRHAHRGIQAQAP